MVPAVAAGSVPVHTQHSSAAQPGSRSCLPWCSGGKAGWPDVVTVVSLGRSGNFCAFGPVQSEKLPSWLFAVLAGRSRQHSAPHVVHVCLLHLQERQDDPFVGVGQEGSRG